MNTLKFKILLSAVCFILTSSLFAQLYEDFEGSSFPPAGWAVFDNGIGLTQSWKSISNQGYLGSKAAYIQKEGGGIAEDWLVTPLININVDKAIAFYTKLTQHGIYGSEFSIRISTGSQTSVSDFSTLQTWNEPQLMNGGSQTSYIQKAIDLTNYTGQSVYIAFVMKNNNGNSWLIDNISFVDSCSAPSQLNYLNVSSTSAFLNWNNNGIATQWEVELLPVNATTNGVGNNTNSNPYYVSGLIPYEEYKFYVRSICPDGIVKSAWIGPKTFKALPPCPKPNLSSFQISNYNGNSASLSWNANDPSSQVSSWEVVVQPNNLGVPNNNTGTIVTQTNFQITNLSPNIIYEVYIRPICNDQTSSWVGTTIVNNNTGGCTGEFNSAVYVSNLFKNLLNHLRQKVNNNEPIVDYTCPELTLLSQYIIDPNPKIYNFNATDFSFSFHPTIPGNTPDVTINNWQTSDDPIINSITIDKNFVNATSYTYLLNQIKLSNNNLISNARVKHINFCTRCVVGEIEPNSDLCINESINFSFNTIETGLDYNWTFYDLDGTTVLFTSNVANPTINYIVEGSYKVKLTVEKSDNKKCTGEYLSTYYINDCENIQSCTVTNPNSKVVKNLVIALVNKLASLPSGTVTSGFTCQELTDLAPYITDTNPAIYNFSYINDIIRFSFANHGISLDVSLIIPQSELPIQDIVLSNYYSFENEFYPDVKGISGQFYNGDETFIRHIDFCPSDTINCERHIAIVVDESGSIDEKEARKIRTQLKSFVTKQLEDNTHGTNVRISLIGLSDSDTDTRTNTTIPNNGNNVILNEIITANNLGLYLNWINGYRTNRVSPNSDYWNSGLNKALEINPDFVILITDGCQTAIPKANQASLFNTMKKFNNNYGAGTTPDGKPHLFVVGIEDGFYVDNDASSSARKSILTKEEDPNLNPELSRTSSTTARVSSFLRTSLKYLMAYGNTDFPSNDKYSFLADYYGANDFNFFYDEPNYLSNGLIAKSVSIVNGETDLYIPVGMSCGPYKPLEGCNDCLNFKPESGKKYIISAWVKEEINKQVVSYTNPTIQIKYLDNSDPKIEIGTEDCIPSGDIIDGWQRIFKQITIPENTAYIQIALTNNSTSIPVYFDDVRIHPMDGSMKSFVYDPETFRLMAELDENNYSTFYEYDKEGGLVRVKKETSRGVKTIQETRSGNVIKQ
ncbi:hypothetical protein FIA58_020075 [Flavobacterium jejuense]|uniref:PKD domain-containing protein n=1 Tax=Flavobacterium jejuense TaxID=1544455 RepID=A0ABX0IWA6_9FLAO|nr:choice-of-anchor J domain-containing protein [Flavobacterium jejuense]NHN27983.1 hypothetical protein [Flavobacterium jejuense]